MSERRSTRSGQAPTKKIGLPCPNLGCNEKFAFQAHVDRHLRDTCTFGNTKNREKYACTNCDFTSNHQSSYVRHLAQQHGVVARETRSTAKGYGTHASTSGTSSARAVASTSAAAFASTSGSSSGSTTHWYGKELKTRYVCVKCVYSTTKFEESQQHEKEKKGHRMITTHNK